MMTERRAPWLAIAARSLWELEQFMGSPEAARLSDSARALVEAQRAQLRGVLSRQRRYVQQRRKAIAA